METNKKFSFKLIIGLIILGLFSGVIGAVFSRVYLADNAYNIPLFGDINYADTNRNNLVIQGANKVVVEQNDKVNETSSSVGSSIVGIIKKKQSVDSKQFNLINYYLSKDIIAQGLVVTSDGWIVSSFNIEKPSDYVVITRDKKVLVIDKVIQDKFTNFYFIHVNTFDLPVIKFANQNEVLSGQLALSVSFSGKNILSSILDNGKTASMVKSSDIDSGEIILTSTLDRYYSGPAIFNLAGEAVGFVNLDNKIIKANQIAVSLSNLLKYKVIQRTSLGLNYIDLGEVTKNQLVSGNSPESYKGVVISKDEKGVAVSKGGPADLAGLKENDIIMSINGQELNDYNNIVGMVQSFTSGDRLILVLLRNGEKKTIELKLGEIK